MRRFIPALTFSFSLAFVTPLAAQNNPVPFVNMPLVPAVVVPGGAGFTLTVNGAGFVNGAVIKWNGSPRTTTFLSSTKLTASILASDVATAGQFAVTISNPSPGGGTSNAVVFEVTTPATTLALTRTDTNGDAGNGPTIFEPSGVAAGYNPADGSISLAVANRMCPAAANCLAQSSTVSFLEGSAVPYIYTGANPSSILYADLNGDGMPDLLTVGDTISVSLAAIGGTFQLHHDQPLPLGASIYSSLTVGDFNRDGHLDLVLPGLSQVYFLPGNGDGTFGSVASLDTGAPAGATSVTTGDFNGDGVLDLAVTNELGDSVSIFLGHGDGTFQTPVDYPTGSVPGPIVTGDFNGDGELDLAVLNGLGKSVSILLGNGDGTFRSKVDYPAGMSLANMTLGDFNGDGILDIAVTDTQCANTGCPATGSVNVLIGNGDGTFLNHLDFATGGSPGSIAAGDFIAFGNGPSSGRAGFAVSNSPGNTVSVYTAQESQSGSPNPLPTISSISPAFVIQGSGSFTLVVNGTNFVSASTILFGAQTEPTTFVSSTQLTASVPGSAIVTAGPVSVFVNTPKPGGGNSTSAIFNVYLPPPTISSISPSSAIAGSPGFALAIFGTNFVSGSTANFGGASRSSVFVNSGQITVAVSSSDILNQGTINVSVTNPFGVNNAGGGTSSALTLTVLPANSQPTIGALIPASATAGGPSFTLTITGTGFSSSSVVTFGSKPVTSAYQGPSEIRATIPASAIAMAGTPLVTVSNPGSNPSVAVSFTINSPVPDFSMTASTSSSTVPAGQTANFSVTLTAVNGTLSDPVTFSASGLPTGANATFTPPNLAAGSSGMAIMLAITTTPHSPASSAASPYGGRPAYARYEVVFVILMMWWLLLAWRSRARRFAPHFLIILLLCVVAHLAACGTVGNSSSGSGPQLNPMTGTPAGTYTITVNATSGSASVQTKVTLTVN